MKREIQNPRPSDGQSKIQNHWAAALILLTFITLAVVYSLVTPPLEAGDESRHYAVVKYMADTGRLPVQEPGEAQIHWGHEGNQPPLYYALAALLTFWIDTGTWEDVYWYNPHTTIGDPLRPDNKNITIHPPGEAWPWRGHVLAIHLIRFLSIAMAAVTVTGCYFMALILFKGNHWLAAGAMAITAFNPMFIFISSAVNNDNAVIMFVTMALWLMVRMTDGRMEGWKDGRAEEPIFQSSRLPNFQASALLGLLIGLGALSKLYALGLLPLAGLLYLWLAYQNDHRPPTAGRRPTTYSENPSRLTHHASRITPHVSRLTYHASRLTPHASRLTLRALTWFTITFLIALAVAGWFYWRNTLRYGDPLALGVMNEVAGQRDETPTLSTVAAEFEGFRIAYWALFGGVNILAGNWIYKVLDWVSLAAAVGVIGFIVAGGRWQVAGGKSQVAGGKVAGSRVAGSRLRADSHLTSQREAALWDISHLTPHVSRLTSHASRISTPTFLILLIWCTIMIAGFIVWNLTILAGQGRLLFPGIAAFSALGMLGLTWWLPVRGQKLVAMLVSLGLFVFATLSPILYIAPAYAKATILTEANLPADLQPINYSYDGQMRLLGYRLHANTVHPAETLPLTLYWQIIKPTDLDYSIFVHLLGRQRQVVGQIDTYPGGGHWPTTLLSPGDILADPYEVPIPPEAEFTQAPTRLLIAAGIYDFHEPGRPGKPATNEAGQLVEPIIASAKLIPWQWPDPLRFDPPVNFSDQITLLSYEIAANQRSVTLNWQANASLDTDYTVFLQVWRTAPLANSTVDGSTAQYVTGFDGPPVQGDYPTSLWEPGEIIVDTHPIDLTTVPEGDYYLLAGLYNPITDERLLAFAADKVLPDYALNLGTLHVAGSK